MDESNNINSRNSIYPNSHTDHGPELWTDWLTPRTDAQAALSVLEGRGAQNKRRSTRYRPSGTNQDEPRKARESTASYDLSTTDPSQH